LAAKLADMAIRETFVYLNEFSLVSVMWIIEVVFLTGWLITGKIITNILYSNISREINPNVTEISPILGQYGLSAYKGV